ncbi:MAG: DUF4402 domain-containing protein [Bacteroidota bacterium]|nr:DUF4402 domain-containing protein [Bacteroidota bacterium]
MKKTLMIFAAIVMMAGFSTTVMAQATASAPASATIVTPIGITKTVDMNFGNIAIKGTAGTVVLAPAGTRTSTGGVTLPATAGTVAAAAFTVSGEGAYTYAITLPASLIITDATTNTMTVNTFTSTPSGTGALTAGSQTLTVGATLNVGASQIAGAYTNATGFDVTVNYN